MTITRYGKGDETLTFPGEDPGFVYQVDEVERCLRAGLTESKVLPLDESIAIMDTCDRIRAPWGLTYPTEK